MATQVFLHDTAATTHRGTNTAGLNTTTSGWLPKATSTSRGSGVVSKITNTVAGATNGVEVTNGAGGTRLEWITDPVDADVTISGTITANIWGNESANNANTAMNVRVEQIAAGTGTLTQIWKSANVTEMSTSNAARNFTGTPTSTAVNKGDRLRITVFGDDAGTMGSGFTFTTAYAGTAAAASGDTYVSFTENFGFQTWSAIGSALITQTTSDSTLGIQGTGGGSPEKIGQSFTLASGADIAAVTLYMKKNNSPTDNVVVDITSSTGGTSLGSATYAASSIPTTITPIQFVFGTPITLAAGTYYIEASRSGATSTVNYAQWYYKLGGSVYAGGGQYASTSGSWGFISNDDMAFIVYEAAVPGSTLYLTDTASAVATADVDREAWTSRGAGVQNDVTNTTNGWVAPVQVTDTGPAGASQLTEDGVWDVGNSTYVRVAQSFQVTATTSTSRVQLKLSKTNSPTDDLTVSIQADSAGAPSGTALASATIPAASLTGTATVYSIDLDADVSLTASTTYWVVLGRSGATHATNLYATRYKATSSSYAAGTLAHYNGTTWTSHPSALDLYFAVVGTPVSWFTKPLTAFTLSGLIQVNRRVLASSASANASVGVEIARVDNDGTNVTVWGYANRDAATTSGGAGEVALSETAYTCYVAGDDLAITDGQRLRIRLYQDDCADIPTVTGFSLTSYYGGTSGGASGDTYLTLQQTLTEFSAGTTVSVTPGAVTFAGQAVLLRTNLVVTAGAVTFAGQTVNTSVATVVSVTPAAITITGQTVALKTTLAVTPAAVALAGQTVNVVLGTVVPVTPGAVTVTGQTVNLVRSIPATPGALTLAGQTVTPTSIIPVTPGAVTFAGQTVTPGTTSGGTTVSVTPAAITFAGQTVNTTLTTTVPATPGAITITGQTVLLLQSQAVTVGAVTISGQSVLLRTNLVVTPAAVSITGQTVNLATAIVVPVTPAAVTISGQTITPTQAQPVTQGAVTLTGQSVALKNTVAATPAAITLTGQTVNTLLTTAVPVTPAAVVLTGQAINLTNTVAVTPGAVTITGQAVGLTGAVNVTATPGAVTLTGQAVLQRTNLVVTPGAVTLQGQTVNTGGVVSVPVTTPGAVTFAGQTVNLLATVVVPVTPAAVTLTGQTVSLGFSQAVTAGAVTVTGQTVNLLTAIVVPATPAAVVLTGQTVNLKNTVAVTPAAVTLQGQTVNTGAVTTVPVTPGAVTETGQTVLLRQSQGLTPAAVALQGQAIGLVRSIPVAPAALTFAGQTVGMRLLVTLQPGTIMFTGLDVHLGIPEEYTVALQGVWRPTIVGEGRHAPTVANRGAHRPTVVGQGRYVPAVTKAGALTP